MPALTQFGQLFGESIAIYILNQWNLCGKPNKLNLVELGPGRGTLIRDALKVFENDSFRKFYDSIESIDLVERSGSLRETQCATLNAGKDDDSYNISNNDDNDSKNNDGVIQTEDEQMDREIEDAKLMLGARLDNDLGIVATEKDAPQSASTPAQSQLPNDDYLKSATYVVSV